MPEVTPGRLRASIAAGNASSAGPKRAILQVQRSRGSRLLVTVASRKLDGDSSRASKTASSEGVDIRKPRSGYMQNMGCDMWNLQRSKPETSEESEVLDCSPSSSKWGNRTLSSRNAKPLKATAANKFLKLHFRQTEPKGDATPLLLIGYKEVLNKLRTELDGLVGGDLAVFNVYVFEDGDSSLRLIDSMCRAAARGVIIEISVDSSLVSAFTRMCEGTTTLAGKLQQLSRQYPDQIYFGCGEIPSHAKYLLCLRADAPPSAIFGGINIGERFADWMDFAVRVEGAKSVGSLIGNLSFSSGWLTRWLSRSAGSVLSCMLPTLSLQPSSSTVMYITNRPQIHSRVQQLAAFIFRRPMPGSFNVLPSLQSFFGHVKLEHYIVAMAYLDSQGVELLLSALHRGSSVELIMPKTPNVYHDSNLQALVMLLKAGEGTTGTITGLA